MGWVAFPTERNVRQIEAYVERMKLGAKFWKTATGVLTEEGNSWRSSVAQASSVLMVIARVVSELTKRF